MSRVPADAGPGPQWFPHAPTMAELEDFWAEERDDPTALYRQTGPGSDSLGPRSDRQLQPMSLGVGASEGLPEPLLWIGDDS